MFSEFLVNCDTCGHQLDHLPRKCSYCGDHHCKHHSLPENHNCIGLPRRGWSNFFPEYNPSQNKNFDSESEKLNAQKEFDNETYSDRVEPIVEFTNSRKGKSNLPSILFILILVALGLFWFTITFQPHDCKNDLICFYNNLSDCNSSTVNFDVSNYKIGIIDTNKGKFEYIAQKETIAKILERENKDFCKVKFFNLTKRLLGDVSTDSILLSELSCSVGRKNPYLLKDCDNSQYHEDLNYEKILPTIELPKVLLQCEEPEKFRPFNGECIPIVKCTDNTLSPDCSSNRPYQCLNGNLIENAETCGCPYGDSIRKEGNSCIDLSNPDITYLELKIHELINNERKQHGLPELQYDERLADIARLHSQDMAKFGFFDHDNLKGEDPTARARKAGYNVHKTFAGGWYSDGIAENIAQNNLYTSSEYINGRLSSRDWQTPDEIAASVVNGWMNSPGHRANILKSDYDREGIGVAISISDEVLVTQNFW